MKSRSSTFLPVVVAAFLAVAVPLGAEGPARRFHGPDGELLPFQSDEEVLDFLKTAKVVDRKEVGSGVSGTLRVLLERDGVRAHAAFRTVEVRRPKVELGKKILYGFHDSYRYEVAAYELARLLGLDNVPPAVLRRIGGVYGSLQIWIEDAMTEGERERRQIFPPDYDDFYRQKHVMRLFDRLIYNFDRNQGNILIDRNWRLWLIDHTRSFNNSADVAGIGSVTVCEREFWERLQALDEEVLRERLGPYLSHRQIRSLVKRREKAIAYVTGLIDQLGRDAVIFERAS